MDKLETIELERYLSRITERLKYDNISSMLRILKPELPVFCYCKNETKKIVDKFKQGLPNLTLSYAVKANTYNHLISDLFDFGVKNFDVASVTEVQLIKKIISQSATLHFNNPIKTVKEISEAYNRYNVNIFAIDDQRELEKIVEVVKKDKNVSVGVRFAYHHPYALVPLCKKFGCEIRDAVNLLKKTKSYGFRPGIVFHVGSQCEDPKAYSLLIQKAAEIVAESGVEIYFCNIGGGLPVHYPNRSCPKLDSFFATIDKNIRDYFSPRVEVICEPGRAMSAPTCVLLARVRHRRGNGTIFIDEGLYGALNELFFLDISYSIRSWRNDGTLIKGECRPVTVCGPTCDSGDIVPQPVNLSVNLKEGDWVEFGLTGAYGSAGRSNFNGFGDCLWSEVEKF